MNKLIISSSMLGSGFAEVLETEIINLCEEFGVPFMGLSEKINEIDEFDDFGSLNTILSEYFPNEIKVII